MYIFIQGSQSSTTLSNTHRAFASLDSIIEGTSTNITKLSTLLDQLNSQEQSIEKSVKKSQVIKSQLETINKVLEKQTH